MTTQTTTAEQCAALAIDLAPMLMRLMRQELNAHEALNVTVPQFRTLRFVARHPTTSLSDLAAHLGMTLPAASKLVDQLLEQHVIARATAADDRRRAELTLTEHGYAALKLAATAAQARLAERLAALSEPELDDCIQALSMLRTCVMPTLDVQEASFEHKESGELSRKT